MTSAVCDLRSPRGEAEGPPRQCHGAEMMLQREFALGLPRGDGSHLPCPTLQTLSLVPAL